MLGEGERWYCVHTLPRREIWAFENLEQQGFRSFLPRLARTVRHARKTQVVRAALFPRYLFTILDVGRDRWRSVNGTFGVIGLLMDGERPRPVPADVVEHLITVTSAQGTVDLSDGLTPGQSVRVLSGPFADRLATVARLDDKGRVAVLLEIMGAERSVTVGRQVLFPID